MPEAGYGNCISLTFMLEAKGGSRPPGIEEECENG
jgi:hypothetical protein